MAFLQQVTDLYVMEGTSFYLVPELIFVDFAAESDRQVQIDSSNQLIAYVDGGEVTLLGQSQTADVPLTIDFDDLTSAVADTTVVLTLILESDSTQITVHILDDDDPDRPTDIGGVTDISIAEDAPADTVVATLSTVDTTPGDTFTYSIIGNSNFVIGGINGNEIRLAENAQIDFEKPGGETELLQVLTTDAAGNVFVKDVTIDIIDTNDPPDLVVADSLTQNIEENAAPYQVDLTLSDFNGDPVAITSVSGDTDFFTLVNAPALNEFAAGVFNFSLEFSAPDFENPLDANGDNVYEYTITVADGTHTRSKTFLYTITDVSPETLNGTIDADTLIGNDDIESILGFAGKDILNGMGNDDRLTGGLGKDWQTGGTGTDIFDFNLKTETVRGANRDVIMDFNRVELDQIDLIGIDARKGAGNQAFKFIGAKQFHDKAGELHYIKKAGFLLVEGDIDGNGKADFQIQVHGVTKLGAIDFNL